MCKLLAAVLCVAIGSASPSNDRPVTVSPKHGGTHTRPRVSFVAPPGTAGRRLAVSAIATAASQGRLTETNCTVSVHLDVFNFTPGRRVTRHLRPDGHWCRDLYRGRAIITP